MTLAMNPEAMQKFASLPETKKQEIINGTHAVSSKAYSDTLLRICFFHYDKLI